MAPRHPSPRGIALALAAAVLAAGGCGGSTTVVTGGPPEATAPADTAPAPATTAATPAGTRPTDPPPPAETRTAPAAAPAEPEDTGGILVERPRDFPNGGEAFILARLHRDVARRCTRADPDALAAGAVAGLECATEAAFGALAYYDLFPARVDAEGAYGRYRRANGVPLARGACLDDPTGSLPAEGPWRAGRRGAGRAMCFPAGGRVWLVTSHPARIVTYLSAPRRAPLVPFWADAAAPTARPR